MNCPYNYLDYLYSHAYILHVIFIPKTHFIYLIIPLYYLIIPLYYLLILLYYLFILLYCLIILLYYLIVLLYCC